MSTYRVKICNPHSGKRDESELFFQQPYCPTQDEVCGALMYLHQQEVDQESIPYNDEWKSCHDFARSAKEFPRVTGSGLLHSIPYADGSITVEKLFVFWEDTH